MQNAGFCATPVLYLSLDATQKEEPAMELAQITAGQVVMLFLLMGTGIAAVKTGVLKPEGK